MDPAHRRVQRLDLGGDRQRVLRAALRGRACGVCSTVSSGGSRGISVRGRTAQPGALWPTRTGAVPARHEVAHVFNSWTEMPTFREQIDLPWTYRGVD